MAERLNLAFSEAEARRMPLPGLGGRASPRVGVLDAVGRRLLDSVIDITAEQDHARFRASFRDSLRELLEVTEVLFVRPVRDVQGKMSYLEVVDSAELKWHGARPQAGECQWVRTEQVAEMLESGQALLLDRGAFTLLLPVIHQDVLLEIIVVRAGTVPTEAFYMLRAFARLYRNFLLLIMATERDALTGLFNRRTLETRLAQLSNEVSQRHAALASTDSKRRATPDTLAHYVAMLDVDRFKKINDSFGHLFGDEVLLLVSRMMKEVLRDEDMLFRYGGEEFCAVLLCQTHEGALAAMNRFRERIAAHRFPQLEQVTLCAGLAQMRPEELPAAAIARADQALYVAKETGRNKVCDYDAELAAGRLKPEAAAADVELF